MADKRLEADDPFEIVGVTLPEAMDDEALTEMACCFVQEMAQTGRSRERILRVFRDPFYSGPHAVYLRMGEAFVRALVEQVPDRGSGRERYVA